MGFFDRGEGNRLPFAAYFLAALVLLVIGALLGRASAGNTTVPPAQSKQGQVAGRTDPTQPLLIPETVDALIGSPNSESGGVRAATGVLAGFQQLANYSRADQDKAIEEMIIPNAPRSLRTLMRTKVDQLGPAFGDEYKSALIPIAYNARYKDGIIEVNIWSVGVAADGQENIALADWGFNGIELRWANDRWYIADWVTGSGPRPRFPDDGKPAATPEEILTLLGDYEAYRYAPAS